MIPRAFVWNNLRLRPLRTLLCITSVAGAVASVIAVLQSAAATRIQMASLNSTLASPVDMEIISTSAGPFSAADAQAALQDLDLTAIPIFRVFTKVSAGTREARCLTTGADSEQFQSVHGLTLTSGALPAQPGEVCILASVAEHLQVAVGDEVGVGSRELPRFLRKTVSGVFEFSGGDRFNDTTALLMPLSDASQLGRARGDITALQIVVHDESSEAAVEERLTQSLPGHLCLANSGSAAELNRPIEAMVGTGLNVTAILAVVAAIFIVFNAFHMTITERQRQIAIMRIVGATTAQMRRSMFREAFLLAIPGTLLGIIPGVFGGYSLAAAMREVMGFTTIVTVSVQPHAVIAGVIFGPLVTLASVWMPSRFVCDAAPLDVLKGLTRHHRYFTRRIGIVTSATFGLAALFFFLSPVTGLPAPTNSMLGVAAVEISAAFILSELISPMAKLCCWLLRDRAPIESRLGMHQLLDSFERTAITAVVLFVVSGTSISVGLTTLMVTRNVEAWINRTLGVDFLVMASKPSVNMSDAESVDADAGARIRSVPGIQAIDEVSFCLATVNGSSALLCVQQFGQHTTLPIDLMVGDRDEIRDSLRRGDVLLGSVLANLLRVRPGDTVRVEVKRSVQQLRVAGVIREYSAGGLILQMDLDAAQDVFSIPSPQVYGIRAEPASRTEVERSLRSLATEFRLIFQSLADLKDLVRTIASGITSQLFLILMLALVIAAFAIVNSLTMNVIEQTRHLGLLRVVGMQRSQAVRMFLMQSLIVGVIGIIPGVATGTLMSYLTTRTYAAVTDHGISFHADRTLLSAYVVCGVALAVAAATIPALRAARLKPLEAIHEE